MHAFPNKLYFDSRFRADKRDAHANCSFSLPGGSLTIPENYCALIDSIHVPNVFESCQKDYNDHVYWQEYQNTNTVYSHISVPPAQQYTGAVYRRRPRGCIEEHDERGDQHSGGI